MIAALITLLLSFLAPPAMDADPAPVDGLVCYEYEQADDAGTGCEPIPGYEAEADAAAEGRDAPELPAQVWSAYETCAPVDALVLEDETLEWMRASGWVAQAGDGMEALYAPGCLHAA